MGEGIMPPLETMGKQDASKAVGVCMCEWGMNDFIPSAIWLWGLIVGHNSIITLGNFRDRAESGNSHFQNDQGKWLNPSGPQFPHLRLYTPQMLKG